MNYCPKPLLVIHKYSINTRRINKKVEQKKNEKKNMFYVDSNYYGQQKQPELNHLTERIYSEKHSFSFNLNRNRFILTIITDLFVIFTLFLFMIITITVWFWLLAMMMMVKLGVFTR